MEFDWSEWIGIATSVVKPLVTHGVKERRLGKRRSKSDYFTITYSSGNVEFEGRFTTTISVEQILEKLLESAKNEPKREDEST